MAIRSSVTSAISNSRETHTTPDTTAAAFMEGPESKNVHTLFTLNT